jgi:hypothetical protein
MKWKYWNAGIHVDATGHLVVRVPADWTQKQIKEFVLEEFFPDDQNTDICDPVDVPSLTETTEEVWRKRGGDDPHDTRVATYRP